MLRLTRVLKRQMPLEKTSAQFMGKNLKSSCKYLWLVVKLNEVNLKYQEHEKYTCYQLIKIQDIYISVINCIMHKNLPPPPPKKNQLILQNILYHHKKVVSIFSSLQSTKVNLLYWLKRLSIFQFPLSNKTQVFNQRTKSWNTKAFIYLSYSVVRLDYVPR